MNGIRIVCDTNPIIYLLDGNQNIAKILDGKQIYLSVITELELFGKPNLSIRDNKIIEVLLDECFVIDNCMDSRINVRWIQGLRKKLKN